MSVKKFIARVAAVVALGAGLLAGSTRAADLLNVSYDPTRELYAEYNQAFVKHWKEKTGEDLNIRLSNGGSGKQTRAVLDGLEADVVTLGLVYDIDVLAQHELLSPDWQKRLPNHSTPYTSTIVFLVRKGNPKQIKDWDDIVKSGVEVITPNPKTSGGARWAYLAAWAWGQKKHGGAEGAKQFVSALYKNVSTLDTGARGSLTTFAQRGLGDVLLSWENEAYLAQKEFASEEFEIVTPSLSILAEPPVSVVDKVVDKRGTRKVAEAYLEYLYSDEGQEIAAKNHYRPRSEAIARKHEGDFAKLTLVPLEEIIPGGWKVAQKTHFEDGGVFDQIFQPQ